MPSNNVAWIEGEAQTKDIIFTLADGIVNATLPDSAVNKWEKVTESRSDMWVTYTKKTKSNIQGKYKHTDGALYDVYRTLPLPTGSAAPPINEQGQVIETNGTTSNTPTGNLIDVNLVTVNGMPRSVGNYLVALVNDPAVPSGRKAVVVQQAKVPAYTGSTPPPLEEDPNWNEFHYVQDAGVGWDYVLGSQLNIVYNTYSQIVSGNTVYSNRTWAAAAKYTFTENYYEADVTHTADNFVVLKATPDVPGGTAPQDFYVMFNQPVGQYNYFDVMQGEGFSGTLSVGNSKMTYEKACDLTTVQPLVAPTVIDQKEADLQYRLWNDPLNSDRYHPPEVKWAMDGVVPVVSPPSHFFFGADSIVSWLANKKRRPDYWVAYWLSVNNNRVALVIEGDPAPDMDSYYRSFGYIGKIVPFADYDHTGNFGITVGMGQLTADRTGFIPDNIKPDKSPIYAGYGRYTSNGMTSVSMLRTRSSVMFQAYYPAFITQLPNYKGVGTIPPELSTLVLEKNGFQSSAWTDKYHASPIYLVHQYEGYRGFMDGVVAINDHNLINTDELVVDTEEWKDPADHSKGTWTEVYKFFSIKSPVSFLKSSANPDECSVAILKEIR